LWTQTTDMDVVLQLLSAGILQAMDALEVAADFY
jgi:hypothetical protein